MVKTSHRIIIGDVLDGLRSLDAGSCRCCVTSPPYWGLRDYGTASWVGGDAACDHQGKPMATKANINANCGTGTDRKNAEAREFYRDVCGRCGALRVDRQIGLEATPDEYVARIVAVFREVRRVLSDDGTCWINIGDSYTAGAENRNGLNNTTLTGSRTYGRGCTGTTPLSHIKSDTKPKDLVGIPWRVAFALQADGWYLRQDIIWAKPNPMPESVTDRCTKSHEYVFLLSKSQRYYCDMEAIAEAAVTGSNGSSFISEYDLATKSGVGMGPRVERETRNARSVWTISTQPYPEAHFATFPEELAARCIKAGSSEKGKCPTCGKPLVRVVERSAQLPCDANAGDDLEPLRKSNNDADRRRQLSGAKQAAWKAANPNRFLGWKPTCECGGDPVPDTVLDPFTGSGTTLAMARLLGRNGVGCELNPTYAAMAEDRIGRTVAPASYVSPRGEPSPLFGGLP